MNKEITKYCFFILLFLVTKLAFGQLLKTDSLLLKIHLAGIDTVRVNLIRDYLIELQDNKLPLPNKYIDSALQLSKQLKYRKGEGQILFLKAKMLSEERKFSAADSVFSLVDSIFLKDKNFEEYGKSLFYRGLASISNSKYDTALYYLKKAKDIFTKTKNFENLGNVCLQTGISFRFKGNFSDALLNYEKALNYFKQAADSVGIANSLINIGLIYHYNGDYNSAIKLFNEALVLKLHRNDKISLSHIYNNLGLSYERLKNIDTAIFFYEKSMNIKQEFGDVTGQANTLLNIGILRGRNKEYESSLNYLNQALILYEKTGKKRGISKTHNIIAAIYKEQKLYDKAISRVLLGIEIADSIGATDNLLFGYGLLADLYEKKNNFKEAYFAYKEYKQLNDSVFSITKAEQIEEIKARHESEKKENDNEKLRIENKLKEQTIAGQYIIGTGLIVIIFLIAGIAILIFRSRQKQKEINKKLMLQNEEIRSQKEEIKTQAEHLTEVNNKLQKLTEYKEALTAMLVHDLKNPLNIILNVKNIESDSKMQIQRTYNEAKKMLNIVLNILDVQKFEDTKMKLAPYNTPVNQLFSDAISEVKYLADEKNVVINYIPHLQTVFIEKEVIKRVLVNLLSNAIKFSPPSNIVDITVANDEKRMNYIKMSISNFGENIPLEKQNIIFSKFGQIDSKTPSNIASTGLGLAFCKLAVEAHNGFIGFSSPPKQPTIFWISLPGHSSEAGAQVIATNTNAVENTEAIDAKNSEKIEALKKQLQSIEIYEITAFRRIIKPYRSYLMEHQTKKWLINLETAVRNGDEKLYRELIK